MKVRCLQTILLLFVISGAYGNFCKDLSSRCAFKFCSLATGLFQPRGKRYTLPAPNVGTQGLPICRKTLKDSVRRIVKTGEPLVIEEANPNVEIPLSKWAPGGLNVPFRPRFFYLGNATRFGRSTLYMKKLQGNQATNINNTCIRIPVFSYEQKAPRGNSITEVNTKRRVKVDCIWFAPRPANFDIVLDWDSNDDLDIEVTEPDGTVVNKNNRKSPNTCISLAKDRGSDSCFSVGPPGGREESFYQKCEAPSGTIRIKAFHFRNCGKGPTNWILTVKLFGKVILERRGKSNGMLSSLVFNVRVVVP